MHEQSFCMEVTEVLEEYALNMSCVRQGLNRQEAVFQQERNFQQKGVTSRLWEARKSGRDINRSEGAE